MDSKHINDKTSPNQMRVFMKRMREGYDQQGFDESVNDEKKKILTMRDMLKITRSLNEVDEKEPEINLATPKDVKYLTDSFMNLFTKPMNVNVKLLTLDGNPKLKLTKNSGFWGGTIDGAIQFAYKATSDEKSSGIEFNYLPEFSHDNPDNDQIIKNIESFYDTFYEYWRDNFQEA
jgi:hypothetical protein